MCGRFALRHALKHMEEEFGVVLHEVDVGPVARYNIAPSQPVITVRSDTVRHVPREMVHLLWGLLPPWVKDASSATRRPINARVETAAEKPSFRHALRRRRCLVPASAIYEWGPGLVSGARRAPHCMRRSDGGLLALGGIWEIWTDAQGGYLETFCLLTTRANELMGQIHDRMPVIIGRKDYERWLDGRLENVAAVSDLMEPCADDGLELYEVSTRVNAATSDGEELMLPYVAPPTGARRPDAQAPAPEDDLFGGFTF